MKLSTQQQLAVAGAVIFYGMALASRSFAQVANLTSGLEWIKTTITGIGIVVIVISIMWTGIQMMFNQAKWNQVANIFFGGTLVGAAAAIGAQVFGGGSAT